MRVQIYKGLVDLYPYGENALVGDSFPKNKYGLFTKFYIGNNPDLVLNDNRKIGWSNADEFRVSSIVRIYSTEDVLEVFLDKKITTKKPDKVILFGTISKNENFPIYDIEYQIWKPLDNGKFAYFLLVNR